MTELVLASGNKGKLAEFQRLLEGLDVQIHSMKEYPEIGEIVEDGSTFAENALIKARAVCKATGKPAMADDSGLAVDALNGAPGIYSARFAGEQRSDADNNAKVLQLLEGVEDSKRTARFFCVIAIVLPDGREYTAEGTCEGTILRALRGEGGFGYDPLFYVESLDKTFAELTMEEKNRISHRGHANRKAVEIIRGLKSE
ncbi:MAG: XTP/dITP diphosphatase [Peptococcaceae bacterium]|nr:XTP/dITP diphosphatase [Peptococcaceae bacterium]